MTLVKEYQIKDKTIKFDEKKNYLDFYIANGKPTLVSVDLEAMLKEMESGQIQVDENLKGFMEYLQRWKTEAPRKRFYRNLRKEGVAVLSSEVFFDDEGGHKIIDKLENTGKFADYFLKKVYGG